MPSNWDKSKSIARRFWIRLALAVGAILVVAAVSRAQQSDSSKDAPAQVTNAQQPALSGTWKLNRDESDDPREKLRSAIQDREQNGTPGGMGGHGGMGGGGIGMGIPGVGGIGGGGMGGPGRQGQGNSGSDEQRARLLDVVEPANQLSVAQKGPEIEISDPGTHSRVLYTDGRKLEKPKKDAPQTEVKAHWERQTLVTEEKGPNGEKISHAYELSSEGKFIDTLTLESKKLNTPLIVRSVYDKPE
jgi:hypothetical protein